MGLLDVLEKQYDDPITYFQKRVEQLKNENLVFQFSLKGKLEKNANLREKEALDGYYALITSEYNESNDRIIEIYRGLWQIEESFKSPKVN